MIRKNSLEESSSLRKAVNPVKLKRHNYCITWSMALKKNISTILGHGGVTLRYVIRECAAPHYDIELQPNYDLKQLSNHCVPLTRMSYKKDTRKSNQLIHGFVHGENVEKWINPTERNKDG